MGFSPAQAHSLLLPRGTNRKAQLLGEETDAHILGGLRRDLETR